MERDVDNMMAFLRRHGNQQFCSTCLAFEFTLSFQKVDSALAIVGQQAVLKECRGQCATCGRRALVTGLENSNGRSPKARVLQFVLDHVGRPFCHACIARLLELNIGTVQKAVWHLRASIEVRIEDMACSGCSRRRLVLGGVNRLDQASYEAAASSKVQDAQHQRPRDEDQQARKNDPHDHVTASESDLTAPSAPPPAKVTEDVARTAVELAMKVAEVLQAGHQGAEAVHILLVVHVGDDAAVRAKCPGAGIELD